VILPSACWLCLFLLLPTLYKRLNYACRISIDSSWPKQGCHQYQYHYFSLIMAGLQASPWRQRRIAFDGMVSSWDIQQPYKMMFGMWRQQHGSSEDDRSRSRSWRSRSADWFLATLLLLPLLIADLCKSIAALANHFSAEVNCGLKMISETKHPVKVIIFLSIWESWK